MLCFLVVSCKLLLSASGLVALSCKLLIIGLGPSLAKLCIMSSEQQQRDSEQQAHAGVGIRTGVIAGAGPAAGAGAGAGAGALFGSFWLDFSFSWCLTVDPPV